MFRALSLLLLLSSSAIAQESPWCTSDGSLRAHNERAVKMFALHYQDRSTPLPDIKHQVDNYNVTYTKPACGPDGHPLSWDELHVVLIPK